MTIEELEASLPNGLHDARVFNIALDYVERTARLEIAVWVGDLRAPSRTKREAMRPAVLELTGLLVLAIEPPDLSYPYAAAEPLCIAVDAAPAHRLFQALPVGCSFRIFVNQWNSFIHVAAASASLAWRS